MKIVVVYILYWFSIIEFHAFFPVDRFLGTWDLGTVDNVSVSGTMVRFCGKNVTIVKVTVTIKYINLTLFLKERKYHLWSWFENINTST